MNTRTLKAQHRLLLDRASELGGLAARIRTREDALEADHVIERIDILLVHHLRLEDDWLYPTLMTAEDPDTRTFATDSFEEMGGILGAWMAYRKQWNADTIQAQADRFALATAGILEALALRISREEGHLYPAIDDLVATPAARPRRSAHG